MHYVELSSSIKKQWSLDKRDTGHRDGHTGGAREHTDVWGWALTQDTAHLLSVSVPNSHPLRATAPRLALCLGRSQVGRVCRAVKPSPSAWAPDPLGRLRWPGAWREGTVVTRTPS